MSGMILKVVPHKSIYNNNASLRLSWRNKKLQMVVLSYVNKYTLTRSQSIAAMETYLAMIFFLIVLMTIPMEQLLVDQVEIECTSVALVSTGKNQQFASLNRRTTICQFKVKLLVKDIDDQNCLIPRKKKTWC